MKVILLTSLCGSTVSYHKGDKATFDDSEAIRLIEAGIAKPAVKKDYALVLEKLAEKEKQESDKQQQMEAILYADELKAEKIKLLSRVDEINVVLEINDLNERYNIVEIDEELEALKVEAKALEIEFNEDVEKEILIELIEKVKEPGKE